MRKRLQPLLRDETSVKSRPRKPRDPAQPNLPFDEMPSRVEPALALLQNLLREGRRSCLIKFLWPITSYGIPADQSIASWGEDFFELGRS